MRNRNSAWISDAYIIGLLYSGGFVGRGGSVLSASAKSVFRRLQYFRVKPKNVIRSSDLHRSGSLWVVDKQVTDFLVKKRVLSCKYVGREKHYRFL